MARDRLQRMLPTHLAVNSPHGFAVGDDKRAHAVRRANELRSGSIFDRNTSSPTHVASAGTTYSRPSAASRAVRGKSRIESRRHRPMGFGR